MFRASATFVSLAALASLAATMPAATTVETTVTATVTAAPAASTACAQTCSTGPIQCCDSTITSSSAQGAQILGLLGIIIDGIDLLLGQNCSPITGVGLGSGNECTANVVCCQNNNVGGLISIGCIPIFL